MTIILRRFYTGLNHGLTVCPQYYKVFAVVTAQNNRPPPSVEGQYFDNLQTAPALRRHLPARVHALHDRGQAEHQGEDEYKGGDKAAKLRGFDEFHNAFVVS
jgi:hypothetical protein